MGNNLRDIRRKMKGVKSTRQVTKAMELVAASKMRRAVQNAQQLRRYSLVSWGILQRIARQNPDLHAWLRKRPIQRVLIVVFTSDRGLAGSLNTQILKAVSQYLLTLKSKPTFESVDFIAVGKKGQQFLTRTGQNVVAAFPAVSTNPSFRDIAPVARLAAKDYQAGVYDHVVMAYSHFQSALAQQATVKNLLPFSDRVMEEMIQSLESQAVRSGNAVETAREHDPAAQYKFEPSPEEVLGAIIPQLTELQMYQALLESVASEHAARMVAMRNATDNASAVLDDLTLTYNQTRQSIITQELAELSASKAALE